MQTLAHQLAPAGCSKTFTFAAFQQILDDDLDGMYGDEKFDGRRYLFQVRPNKAKHNYLTSRRVSKTTGLLVEKQDSLPFFRDCAFGPRDSVYDGEMVHPDGGTSHEAATAIAQGFAIYRLFDVLRFNGEDVRDFPQKARWKILEGLDLPDRVYHVRHSRSPRRLLRAVQAIGGEGMILKLPDAIYGEGWFKVVSEEFYDVVVIGFEMSDSDKYGPKKWIKSIRVGEWVQLKDRTKTITGMAGVRNVGSKVYALLPIGQISGFDESLRAKISANPQKYMGRVVILKAKGRETSGAFRHPRFFDWHPDKNPNECIRKGAYA